MDGLTYDLILLQSLITYTLGFKHNLVAHVLKNKMWPGKSAYHSSTMSSLLIWTLYKVVSYFLIMASSSLLKFNKIPNGGTQIGCVEFSEKYQEC
jgi:hypothetical protein